MSLKSRLERIERYMNTDKCPLCGQPWTEQDAPTFDIHWRTYDDPLVEPENCPECGRPLTVMVRWLTANDETPRTGQPVY